VTELVLDMLELGFDEVVDDDDETGLVEEDTTELLELRETELVLDRLELDLLDVVAEEDETGLVEEDTTELLEL